MYGLPEDTKLTEFVGCRLAVVSVGQHQVSLGFDGRRNIGITIEGDFSVRRPGAEESVYSEAPAGAGELIALLGSEVVAVAVSEPGTTTVKFADGSAIAVFDSESHFESYQIHIGARLIVV